MWKKCLMVFVVWTTCVLAVTEQEVAKMQEASPSVCPVPPQAGRHLLVFNRCDGFKHSSIPYWDKALEIMSQKSGAFTVSFSSDMSVFDTVRLKAYDAICLNNTTGLTFTDTQKRALLSFVKDGKGLVGIHAATDNFGGWPEASTMIGGTFTGHPWTSGGTWAVKVDDPNHPLMASFKELGFKINDEIYRTDAPYYDRAKQRVLMSLDLSDPVTKNASGVKPSDWDTGLSWVKTYGKGRVFYCSLGHNHHITWNEPILAHYLAGIQFALGDLKVDTTPIESQATNLNWTDVDAVLKQVALYEYAGSKESLNRLEQMAREAAAYPRDQRKLEEALASLLTQNISIAAKDFVCRQLRLIGSESSVPALMTLLADPDTEYMARMALESIPGKGVDQRLCAVLPNMPAKVQIGIMSTLGRRADDRAVIPIAEFLTQDDPALATHAARSLGSIGSEDALSALNLAKGKVPGEVKIEVLHALLLCGENLVSRSQTEPAVSLYKSLMATDNPGNIRIGAMQGLIEAEPGTMTELILQVIDQKDETLMPTALSLVARLDNAAQIESVAAKMSSLPAEDQVLLLSALSRTRQSAGLDTVKQAVKSPHEAVQLAALTALGKMGDETCVAVLAKYAGQPSPSLQPAARSSLNEMYSEAVTSEIKRLLSQTRDPVVRVALLRAVADRQMTDAMAGVRSALDDTNRVVKNEALKTISALGSEADMDLLVTLLLKAPQRAIEDAIVMVTQRTDQAEKMSRDLADKAMSGSAAVQMSALRVASRLGQAPGLVYVETLCQSDNDRVKTEAVRALSNWPTRAGLALAEKMAQRETDTTCRVLALRGYIKMAVMPSNQTTQARFDTLAKAMTLASRDDERKMVLSALPQTPCKEALDMALSHVTEASLTAEAQAAVMDLCDALQGSHPDEVSAALVKMSGGNVSASIKNRIDRLQKAMN
ncbi:MAG: ThuA domain-containing protein [Phycisphaerae bacterium]|nr:ThuA domain-containing protein [Phycisphaerae bacterium]